MQWKRVMTPEIFGINLPQSFRKCQVGKEMLITRSHATHTKWALALIPVVQMKKEKNLQNTISFKLVFISNQFPDPQISEREKQNKVIPYGQKFQPSDSRALDRSLPCRVIYCAVEQESGENQNGMENSPETFVSVQKIN